MTLGGLHSGAQDEPVDGVVAVIGNGPVRDAQDVSPGGQLNLGEAGYSPRLSSASRRAVRIHAPRRTACSITATSGEIARSYTASTTDRAVPLS